MKLDCACYYPRIDNVLRREAQVFGKFLTGRMITIRNRFNERLDYPVLVVQVCDTLVAQGYNLRTVNKNRVLALAYALATGQKLALKKAIMPNKVEAVTIEDAIIATELELKRNQKCLDALNAGLAEALKIKRTEIAIAGAMLAGTKVQLEQLRRLRQPAPEPDQRAQLDPGDKFPGQARVVAPVAEAPTFKERLSAATAVLSAVPPTDSERQGRPMPAASDEHQVSDDATTLNAYFPGRLDSLVVAKWAAKYRQYIEKTRLSGRAPTPDEAVSILEIRDTRLQRVGFIRRLLEQLPKGRPLLGPNGAVIGALPARDVGPLAWLIAVLAPRGLSKMDDEKLRRAIQEAVRLAPNTLLRLL